MRAALAPVLAAAALLSAACQGTTDAGIATSSLVGGFQSVPYAFANVSSTFAATAADDSVPWCPPGSPGHEHGHGDPHGPGGPIGFGTMGMMGGGLGGPFMGLGFGPGFGHRPPGEGDPFAACDYNASTGRVECVPDVHEGLTITKSAAFKTASGATQTAFDSLTTNSINTRITVTGTRTRHDGDVSQVNHQSDRTVSGLAPGSLERTVNGTSSGQETTTGADSTGSFTAVRTAGDTIQTVVIPVTNGMPSYPVNGTVVRSMKIVVSYANAAATTSTRREVITYDGTNTAKIVITQDGVTRNCTLPLPHGRISCA